MFESYKRVLANLPEYSKNIFRKGYFKWLLGQVKGWSKISYSILAVNFIVQIYILVTTLMGNPSSALFWGAIFGFIGSNFAMLCVVGISERSSVQGYAGYISGIFIILSAVIAHNYANVVEQLVYIIFLDTFCILDPKWGANIHAESFKSYKDWFKYLGFFVIILAIIYYIFSLTNDPNLFWDSLTLALALTGSLLELNLKKEQYVVWCLLNLSSVCLWFMSMGQSTASPALFVLYILFFANSLHGMQMWYKDAKATGK